MKNYKRPIEKDWPKDWPDWLKNGPVKCRVWNSRSKLGYERWVWSYSSGYDCPYTATASFEDCSEPVFWKHAEPIDQWEPEDGEIVYCWQDFWGKYCLPDIARYKEPTTDEKHIIVTEGGETGMRRHVAKADCPPMTIDELKKRGEWL